MALRGARKLSVRIRGLWTEIQTRDLRITKPLELVTRPGHSFQLRCHEADHLGCSHTHTQPSLHYSTEGKLIRPQEGFEPTMQEFQRSWTVRASDRDVIVIVCNPVSSVVLKLYRLVHLAFQDTDVVSNVWGGRV